MRVARIGTSEGNNAFYLTVLGIWKQLLGIVTAK